jgi:hypothetical protein
MAANPKITGRYKRIDTAGVYELGDSGDNIVASFSVHVKPSTSPALNGGSITVKARPKGTDAETNSHNAGVAVPYIKSHLNGSVGDETAVSTAITGESLIIIPATGRVPILDVATITAGYWDVYIDRAQGSA